MTGGFWTAALPAAALLVSSLPAGAERITTVAALRGKHGSAACEGAQAPGLPRADGQRRLGSADTELIRRTGSSWPAILDAAHPPAHNHDGLSDAGAFGPAQGRPKCD